MQLQGMGVKRVYNASLGRKAPFTTRSRLVLAWWLCSLLMNCMNLMAVCFLSRILQQYEHAEDNWEQFLVYIRSEIPSHQWDLASAMITVPTALITIALVRCLTREQNRLAESARHT